MTQWKTIDDGVKWRGKDGDGFEVAKPITEGDDGIVRLRNFVRQNGGNGAGSGGIAIWCDTDSQGAGRGAALAAFIRERGYKVDESEAYTNPGHGGRCRVWMWYYQLEPEKKPVEVTRAKRIIAKRPVSAARRKKVVPKAKTVKRGLADRPNFVRVKTPSWW